MIIGPENWAGKPGDNAVPETDFTFQWSVRWRKSAYQEFLEAFVVENARRKYLKIGEFLAELTHESIERRRKRRLKPPEETHGQR